MEAGIVYDDSHVTNALFKNETIPCTSEALDSLWVSNSSPSFHGSASMVNFEVENKTQMPFVTKIDTKVENCNDDFNGCLYQPEKKRRLSQDQVQFLEKSFEMENKLEPERKIRLAKELGLHPRQVTIWFQNRRARYRTKNLEKEYGCLKASYERLEQDSDALFKDNEKLKNEVQFLKDKLHHREKKPNQEPCEPINPLDLHPKHPISASNDEPLVVHTQVNASSSAKSGVFDSDSPHYADVALLEPADYSRVIETEASDISQDEDDDDLSKSLLPPAIFPKLETECFDDLLPNSCSFAFPVQDQGTWFWQY